MSPDQSDEADQPEESNGPPDPEELSPEELARQVTEGDAPEEPDSEADTETAEAEEPTETEETAGESDESEEEPEAAAAEESPAVEASDAAEPDEEADVVEAQEDTEAVLEEEPTDEPEEVEAEVTPPEESGTEESEPEESPVEAEGEAAASSTEGEPVETSEETETPPAEESGETEEEMPEAESETADSDSETEESSAEKEVTDEAEAEDTTEGTPEETGGTEESAGEAAAGESGEEAEPEVPEEGAAVTPTESEPASEESGDETEAGPEEQAEPEATSEADTSETESGVEETPGGETAEEPEPEPAEESEETEEPETVEAETTGEQPDSAEGEEITEPPSEVPDETPEAEGTEEPSGAEEPVESAEPAAEGTTEVEGEEEPEGEAEPASAEQAEEAAEEPPAEEPDDESIKDVLEREAERAQQEEEEEPEEVEEEAEEELPEGYLDSDQLPEEEEFTVPAWIKNTGWTVLALVLTWLFLWYILLPGIESILTSRIQASLNAGNYRVAGFYFRLGSVLGGLPVKYPDKFQADYFGTLVDHDRLDTFERTYEDFAGPEAGPLTRAAYAEYLCATGQWEELVEVAVELQKYFETRGLGYLFAARGYLERTDLENGQLDRARTALEKAQSFRGGDVSLARLERDIAMESAEWEAAARPAKQVFDKLDPENERNQWDKHNRLRAPDYYARGLISAQLGEMSSAMQMFDRTLGVEPKHKMALRKLISYFTRHKRWTRVRGYLEGDQRFTAFRKLYPIDSLGWWALAELELESNRRVDSTIRYLQRGQALTPSNPEVPRVAGKIYLDELAAPELAVSRLERSRSLGLERDSFQRLIARAYYEAGLYLEAAEEYEKLNSRDALQGNPALLFNIASSYLGARRLDQAKTYLDRAEQQGYEKAPLYNQRGLLHEIRGDSEAAVTNFFQGKELAEADQRNVERIKGNLNRFWRGDSPYPLSDWLAPVEREF